MGFPVLIALAFVLVSITFMKKRGNVHGMSLEHMRAEISNVDAGIIRLIAKRQELVNRVAEIKIRDGIAIHDRKRTAEVLESVFNLAVENRIDPVSVQKIFEILIAMSEERQHERSGEGNLP
jgi:chorismate mutase